MQKNRLKKILILEFCANFVVIFSIYFHYFAWIHINVWLNQHLVQNILTIFHISHILENCNIYLFVSILEEVELNLQQ